MTLNFLALDCLFQKVPFVSGVFQAVGVSFLPQISHK